MLSCQVDLTSIIREILFENLTRVDTDIPLNYLRSSVEELIELKEKAERARELLSILDRADKVLKDGRKPNSKKNSSISVIRDVLRMRKFVVA